jgi:putative ABC transport system permease protein
MMQDVLKDLGFAVRLLVRRPGFALSAVLILALGIGTATAVFSVINGVVLKPLPYGNADRAVMIWSSWTGFPETWVSYDEYEAWQSSVRALEEVAIAYSPLTVTLGGVAEPESVKAAAVTESLLRVLDVNTMAGRNFLRVEDVPGSEPVALIGYDLWQRRFGADPEIVNSIVDIDGSATRVVGILPAGFRMPMDYGSERATEVLQALAADPVDYDATPGEGFSPAAGSHTFYGFGRLAPGASIADANVQLDALSERLNADGVYPSSWNFRAQAVALPEQVTGHLHPALWGLAAAVVLVLIIASANVAGLMLIRGELRRREFGVRTALGAKRAVLARQVLIETCLLALLAGIAGACIAWLAIHALHFLAPATLPRFNEIGLDGSSLAFALSASVLITFLAGVVPAAQAAGAEPDAALQPADRQTEGSARVSARSLLIVAEVALAVVLVASAGLMVRTVTKLTAIDPGFDSDRLVTMEIALASSQYPTPESVSGFFRTFQSRVEALPGVTAASLVRVLPLAREIGDMSVSVAGLELAPGEQPSGEWQVVSPGYFRTMNIDLLNGRDVRETDGKEQPVIVINDRFAKEYLPGSNPLGRTVRIGNGTEVRVVGVVANTKHNDLTTSVKPRFYIPHEVFAQRTMHLLAKTEGDPSLLIAGMRRELQSLDPAVAPGDVRMMSDIVAHATAQPRFIMFTLSGFGALALLLGFAGIHAVLGYAVSRRTREIGIRMSVGARRATVFGAVLRQGLVLVLSGVAVGSVLALVLTHFLESQLVDVSPADPLTFLATALVFLCAGALACLQPALRAMAVNPIEALRYE